MPSMADNAMEQCQAAPVGAIGEINVQGPMVSKGYLGDQLKTELAFSSTLPFLPEPCPGRRTPRAYRTRDLARYLDDGTFELIGRRDTQVKLRGQRIEAGEIEYHIERCLLVDQKAVVEIVSPDGDRDHQLLAAFLAIGSSRQRRASDDISLLPLSSGVYEDLLRIKGELATKLPPFMVPTAYIPLNLLPTTLTNKVDRMSLCKLVTTMDKEELAKYFIRDCKPEIAANTPEIIANTAEKFRQRCAEVLWISLDKVTMQDSFLALGGDSVRAMKLASIARADGLELTVRDLLSNRPLHELSAVTKNTSRGDDPALNYIMKKNNVSEERDALNIFAYRTRIVTNDFDDVSVATDWQLQMLGCNQMITRDETNHLVFTFDDPLCPSKLENACRTLVQHYPNWRTKFHLESKQVYQIVLKHIMPIINHKCIQSTLEQSILSVTDSPPKCAVGLEETFPSFTMLHEHGGVKCLIIHMTRALFDGATTLRLTKDLDIGYQCKELSPVSTIPSYVRWLKSPTRTAAAEIY